MDAITVTNASLGLRKPVLQLKNPESLKDTDLVNSGDRLRILFCSFEETLEGLKLSPGIAVIPSLSFLGREYTRAIAVKLVGDEGNLHPGEAAIFKVDIDEKTGFNESRFGIGRYEEGSFIIPPDNYRHAQKPVTVATLKAEFKKFLDATLPKVLEWDEQYAQSEFDGIRPSHHLSDWLIVRMLNNLPDESNVTVGGEEVDVGDARAFAAEALIRATKRDKDTVELYMVP